MMIKITPRLYQEKIFASATKQNTLVILPTGLGKTLIALMLSIHRLKKFPESKILFLAPTKPLCEQHKKTFEKHIKGSFALLTGAVKPSERENLWKQNETIFATPQTITSDLINRRISLKDVSLIIFDEAHKATGNYDYVFLAKNYVKQAKNPRILGLTASPGDSKENINNICKNLSINQIEIKNEESADVKGYVNEKKVKKIFIELPEGFKDIKRFLEKALKKRLNFLKSANIIKTADINKIRKRELIQLQNKLGAAASEEYSFMKYVSEIAACIKLMHCLELLQTQGVKSLAKFIEKLKEQRYKVKATKSLMEDADFREAMALTFELEQKDVEHPKFKKLTSLINPKGRTIVFANFRSTVERIVYFLNKVPEVKAKKFVGQKIGMSQKEQTKTLKEFREGKHNVLVSSSIGEEGLDIPEVDKVIFFEPVPSALRTIQRSGRTARIAPGEVVMLITKDTIDEKYYWISFRKQKNMKNALEEIKSDMENNQRRIGDFGESKNNS